MCASSSRAIMCGLQCYSQLGDDGQFQATYDCSIIEIYQLEPCVNHIIFLNDSFICIMDMLNI